MSGRNERHEPSATMREAAILMYDWYQSMLAVGFSQSEAAEIIARTIAAQGHGS